MKKLIFALLLVTTSLNLAAKEDKSEKKAKKEGPKKSLTFEAKKALKKDCKQQIKDLVANRLAMKKTYLAQLKELREEDGSEAEKKYVQEQIRNINGAINYQRLQAQTTIDACRELQVDRGK